MGLLMSRAPLRLMEWGFLWSLNEFSLSSSEFEMICECGLVFEWRCNGQEWRAMKGIIGHLRYWAFSVVRNQSVKKSLTLAWRLMHF